MIIIVSLLLALCVCVDYASDTITANNTTLNIPDNTVVVNESTEFNNEVISMDHKGKVHTDKSVPTKKKQKKKLPSVTIKAKPSCGCRHGYYWHKNTFVDYCPHCHNSNCLRNVHKYQARYEQELTCTVCGADYCGVCGKEKYSWSHYYIKKGYV